MTDFVEVAEGGAHRQHGLDYPPVIPLAAPTAFEVVRSAGSSMHASITQHQHPVATGGRENLEMDIGRGRGGPPPADDESPAVQQHPQLDADDPAVVRHTLAAHLVRAAPFPDRLEPFDPRGIDDASQRDLRHESITPAPRACEPA